MVVPVARDSRFQTACLMMLENLLGSASALRLVAMGD
jgi:hypothetical protein